MKKSCVQLGAVHRYVRVSDRLLKCLCCGSEMRAPRAEYKRMVELGAVCSK